jgi:lysophospholipase L1-like esterase
LATFSGTAIDLVLRDDGGNEYQIVVDGAPAGVLKATAAQRVYPLAAGLSDGPHAVGLFKRTEPKVGEAQFFGFESGGKPLPTRAPPAATRKIELVGDSITAGFGNDAEGPGCPFSPATENEYLTYGAIAARNLGADHVTLAWSGATTAGLLPLYDRTLPARPESRWDFSAWVPDAVVVNIGTNDFANRDPGQRAFTDSYLELVHRVRARYPNAFILCALGPMLSDTYPPAFRALTSARTYIKVAVAKLQADGDARVAFLEFPQQDPNNGYGCAFHPNLKTHRLMAERLTDALRSRLGW